MLDVEKFLIALRSNKDPDGLLKPIFLANTVQEEIKIIQAAVENSRRDWVGLTEAEMKILKQKRVDDGMTRIVSDFEYIRSIEAKLKEKNHG